MSINSTKMELNPDLAYLSRAFELNSQYFDLLESLNFNDARWNHVHELSVATGNLLINNIEFKTRLLNSPILCVSPLLQKKEQWIQLCEGDISRLQESVAIVPNHISQVVLNEIKNSNRQYLRHIVDAAIQSPIAALELGVTPEIIEFLRNMTVSQRNHALNFQIPLFKWRHQEFTDLSRVNEKDLSFDETAWLSYLISTTPATLLDLNSKSEIGKRYKAEHAYPYAQLLVTHKMRATIIRQLIPNLHEGKIRDLYKRVHGESSTCGQLPTSGKWYFDTERRRLHSSLALLLYRLAYKAKLEHVPSIIAAYSWYLMLISDPHSALPMDRVGLLINQAQSGSGTIYAAACRRCTANYLLCNSDDKREFTERFYCHVCAKRQHAA